MYPFPSLGGFLFKREEHSIFGTDTGWVLSPSFSSQRPLGSSTNVNIALAIGSKERSFELNLTADRFNQLESFINTRILFTDWNRPLPDSRQVFVSGVVPLETELISSFNSGVAVRKVRTRVTLVTA